jgi:hypothetical protein
VLCHTTCVTNKITSIETAFPWNISNVSEEKSQ